MNFTKEDWKNVAVTALGVAAAAFVTLGINWAIGAIRGVFAKKTA
jgi:hypothetical protein